EDDYHDFIGEASLGYGFGESSKLSLDYKRQVYVSSIAAYQNVLHSRLTLSLFYKISQKVGGTVYATMMNDDYRGGTAVVDREDDFLGAGVGLKYAMREWLVWDIAYDYLDRDSNLAQSDYVSQVVLLSVEVAF
ncbi:MAG: outer membrane beta-barrel protein, partial [Thermodesulfobacteriota bacterium]|nr:outer membrane beta-barrel protein [Thermodesulfobacteriota bacterium]